jgi:ABC-2 type transport system ATP-binding protein
MAVAAIRTSRLTKDYGGGRGIFDLDLDVQPDQVFGLVGPNGAGKSTAVRCVMGMIRPTRGSAFVFGIDCLRDAVEVARRVGYLPGDLPQFGEMRGEEVVGYLGAMHRRADPVRVKRLAERFKLDLSRRLRESSTGDRQKLCILLAFVHAPDLLVLDEPFAHLDDHAERELQTLIQESRSAGATVFLTDPVPSAIVEMCDRVATLRAGRLVLDLDSDGLAVRA